MSLRNWDLGARGERFPGRGPGPRQWVLRGTPRLGCRRSAQPGLICSSLWARVHHWTNELTTLVRDQRSGVRGVWKAPQLGPFSK